MSCHVPAAEFPFAAEAPARRGRAMTRCECAELPFAEIERRLREERQSLEDVARRTGCASTCTACLPDLRAYLARG
jgi:bacterioferritin-associated ferredoxin